MDLRDEIKQSKPFLSAKEELWLNLSRTAAALSHELEKRLRPYGLSPTQYNVLRILRGAGEPGLCQHEIGERLVAQVPDVPRIVDRMERAGWVRRARGEQDRRTVMATLTEEGLRVVAELDGPVSDWAEGLFGSVSEADLHYVNRVLVAGRS